MDYVVINVSGYMTVLPVTTIMSHDIVMYQGIKEDCFKYADTVNKHTVSTCGFQKTDFMPFTNQTYNR